MTVSLVGSTGSIGTQALEVIEGVPSGSGWWPSGPTARSTHWPPRPAGSVPRWWPSGTRTLAVELARALPPGIEVVVGTEGLAAIATVADVAVNGVVGFAGLTGDPGRAGGRSPAWPWPTRSRSSPGPRWCSGPGPRRVPRSSPSTPSTAPSTSASGPAAADDVGRLLLTASGGPFRGWTGEQLASVGVEEALAHPTWSMGPKITVDSSTLMNKGLEVIEAHELFGIPYDAIDVVVHPQSVVHSMVEFTDGAVVAQLSMPDMRLPIGYALAYPDRLATAFGAIDWAELAVLEFEQPDRTLFRCLDLAYRAGRAGDLAPAWLNAANEVAVAGFLDGRISWQAIADVVEGTLDRYDAVVAGWSARPRPPDRGRARRRRHRPPGGRRCRAGPGGGGMSTTDLRPPVHEGAGPEPVPPAVGAAPAGEKSPRRLAAELVGRHRRDRGPGRRHRPPRPADRHRSASSPS